VAVTSALELAAREVKRHLRLEVSEKPDPDTVTVSPPKLDPDDGSTPEIAGGSW
jgi:hypothetical protein